MAMKEGFDKFAARVALMSGGPITARERSLMEIAYCEGGIVALDGLLEGMIKKWAAEAAHPTSTEFKGGRFSAGKPQPR